MSFDFIKYDYYVSNKMGTQFNWRLRTWQDVKVGHVHNYVKGIYASIPVEIDEYDFLVTNLFNDKIEPILFEKDAYPFNSLNLEFEDADLNAQIYELSEIGAENISFKEYTSGKKSKIVTFTGMKLIEHYIRETELNS